VGSLLLSAGERSGDLLGGRLLTELLGRRPNLHITGVAGDAMRVAGGRQLAPIAHVEQLSGAGLVELLPRLPSILKVRRALVRAITQGQPDLVVFIDAPDLHLPLLRLTRRVGIPSMQLVSPQFWAWRPARARQLQNHTEDVLCLFQFERELLQEAGAKATWVGHPVVERATKARAQRTKRSRPRLVLLPGSRAHERARHTRPFLRAAREATRGQDVDVVLSWPAHLQAPVADVETSSSEGITLLADADAALVAPGTATLEAAMVDCPLLVAGALHPVSAFVARRMLRDSFVALPNILMNSGRVPEVLQDLSLGRLLPPLRAALRPNARPLAISLREELSSVLGPPGFAQRAATAVLSRMPPS